MSGERKKKFKKKIFKILIFIILAAIAWAYFTSPERNAKKYYKKNYGLDVYVIEEMEEVIHGYRGFYMGAQEKPGFKFKIYTNMFGEIIGMSFKKELGMYEHSPLLDRCEEDILKTGFTKPKLSYSKAEQDMTLRVETDEILDIRNEESMNYYEKLLNVFKQCDWELPILNIKSEYGTIVINNPSDLTRSQFIEQLIEKNRGEILNSLLHEDQTLIIDLGFEYVFTTTKGSINVMLNIIDPKNENIKDTEIAEIYLSLFNLINNYEMPVYQIILKKEDGGNIYLRDIENLTNYDNFIKVYNKLNSFNSEIKLK